MAKSVKSKNTVLVSLHLTTEQKGWLDEMGGVTKGINKLFGFWYSNYEIWEKEEERRESLKRKLESIYKKRG